MKKITIVTVVFNDRQNIERTIQSVLSQSFKNYEYVIIDGNSKDGTQEIISKYADNIATYISEPDHGIYDAMNKAIDKAAGEWILFMNSGDIFYNTETLESLFKDDFDSDIDVVYGDTVYVYKWGKTLEVTPQPLKFSYNLPFTHQSALVRTKLLKERKFDLSYRVLADLESFYYFFKNNYRFQQVHVIISEYDMSGFSYQHPILLFEENARIFGYDTTSLSYKLQKAMISLRYFVVGLLPEIFIDFARKYKCRKKIIA